MSFGRVAGVYSFLEHLVYGGALQRARVEHLDFSGEPRVLLLGDGDGRFLGALLAAVPRAEIDVVEASGRMIEQARRRVPDGAAVAFHETGVGGFQPAGSYDVVASHFFLDCFDRGGIARVAGLVARCLAEDGRWLISDFQMPQGNLFGRSRAMVLLPVMYAFFRLFAGLRVRCLTDPDPVLAQQGFVLESRVISNSGFVRADAWRRAGEVAQRDCREARPQPGVGGVTTAGED